MIGRAVGPYDLLRELGQGGMATVYLARHRERGEQVALKELSALRVMDPTDLGRFMRESRLASSLSHPNIVPVYEAFEDHGRPYIAMEYLGRGSLRPWVGRLRTRQTFGVLRDVLAGLAHAEGLNIVHRDLKPENLLVTAAGGVKIADYGLAKAIGESGDPKLTRTGMALGTPDYIAPEQAVAAGIGPATDIYSLGIIAYELLTGRTPFEDAKGPMAVIMCHVNEPPPPLRTFAPRVHPVLGDWVDGLLAKDPKDRPASADAARAQMEEIAVQLVGPGWEDVTAILGEAPADEIPRGAGQPPSARRPSWAGASPQAPSPPPPAAPPATPAPPVPPAPIAAPAPAPPPTPARPVVAPPPRPAPPPPVAAPPPRPAPPPPVPAPPPVRAGAPDAPRPPDAGPMVVFRARRGRALVIALALAMLLLLIVIVALVLSSS